MHLLRCVPPAVVLLGSLAALPLTTTPGPAAQGNAQWPDTSAKAVLAAADRYLSSYQKQLTFLLADETYQQDVFDDAPAPTASRAMTGELFVTFLAPDHAWLAVHDVATIDGAPVPDRDDLRAMLAREPVAGVARRLVQRNARFNIGNIVRNFNEPTLGLLVLDPRRRAQFKFTRQDVERDGATTLVRLAFRETDRPTLVRGLDGRDVYSSGTLTVEADTGRIRRTEIHFTYTSIVAELATTYAHDANLDLWVPATFVERYARRRPTQELILCQANYTDWRRFEVQVRIR
jgi:hypothetical protein